MNNSKDKIEVLDTFVVRSPLLSYGEFERFFSLNDGSLNSKIAKFFSCPLPRIALLMASPSLYKDLDHLLDNNLEIGDYRKVKKSLLKYIIRMTTRPTPFSIMAGVNIGSFQEESSIRFNDNSEDIRFLPDMSYLNQIFIELVSQQEFIQNIKYFPNPTIYTIGKKLRFFEYSYTSNNFGRSHFLSTVDNSTLLHYVLKKSKKGEYVGNIIHLLEQNGIDHAAAKSYVIELVKSKVLINELELHPNAPKQNQKLNDWINTLKNAGSALHFQQVLKKINNLNDSYDVNKILDALNSATQDNLKKQIYVQANLFKKPTNASLDYSVKKEIKKGIEILSYFCKENNDSELIQFKELYFEKYEKAFMPLVEVLDPETGIGFPPVRNPIDKDNKLTENLNLDHLKSVNTRTYNFTEIDDFLAEIFLAANYNHDYEVDLQNTDFRKRLKRNTQISDSFYVNTEIYNNKDSYLINLKECIGPSGAKIIARFTEHKDFKNLIKCIIQKEDELNNNCVLAEVNHLPQVRAANIINYNNFRQFNIPFLVPEDLTSQTNIALKDIFIGIQNDKLVLYSKKLKKIIIPRITNLFNYKFDNNSIYRFFCALQHQGTSELFWSWGFLEGAPFMPRIVFGNIVLSKARWNIQINEKITFDQFILKIEDFKQNYSLPRHANLIERDSSLLIDLENNALLSIVYDSLQKYKKVSLEETFVLKHKTLIEKNDEPFNGEFIFFINYYNKRYIPDKTVKEVPPVKRKFTLGTEWLTFKIYSGYRSSDLILKVIHDLVKKLYQAGLIKKWFFIKFHDPKFHIRWRLEVTSFADAMSLIFPTLQKLAFEKTINEYSLHDYTREIEKYGPQTITLCEEFFCIDSEKILSFLTNISFNYRSDEILNFALKSTDRYLNDFGFGLEDKLNYSSEITSIYLNEFQLSDDIKFLKSLNKKYTTKKKQIQKTFSTQNSFIDTLLNERSEMLGNTIASIKSKTGDNLSPLISSLIHMSMIRLFKSQPRFKEMIMYNTLTKYYLTQKHRVEI